MEGRKKIAKQNIRASKASGKNKIIGLFGFGEN